MGNTWVTDMRHFLDDAGTVVALPGRALRLAAFLGSIVAWVTSGRATGNLRTNVMCRRSPGHHRCAGEIVARLEADGAVVWRCPVCRDNGITRGWEGTPWDRRPNIQIQPIASLGDQGNCVGCECIAGRYDVEVKAVSALLRYPFVSI
jgi:hypothetical protein